MISADGSTPLDRRALARALTHAANASVADALESPGTPAGRTAVRIGFTGAPGAGKSTLITRLARLRLEQTRRIGVLAIDPSSPYTAGAILGDRIRMESIEHEPNLYIRSLASRCASDGLTDNLPGILDTFDRYGFDEVLLETVGIGQADTGVRRLVDIVVVVLSPDSGDHVQAMKAGLLEIADLYLVTKGDLPGARRVAADLHAVRALVSGHAPAPAILVVRQDDPATLASANTAIDALIGQSPPAREDRDTLRARRCYHAQSLLMRRCTEVIATLTGTDLDRPVGDIYRTILERMAESAARTTRGA